MQIGLRKRLRARNSLFDLVGRRNIDRLSTTSINSLSPDQSVDDIPPLPSSPPSSPPSSVSLYQQPSQDSSEALSYPPPSPTMAPVRESSTTAAGHMTSNLAFRKIQSDRGKKREKTDMVGSIAHYAIFLFTTHC